MPGAGPGPIISTFSAIGIAAKKATLRGAVNPNGLATTYWFEYWKKGEEASPSYAPAAKDGEAGSESEAVAVSARIEGLKGATTYEFRLRASNAEGEGSGSVESFTTRVAIHVIERPPMRQHILATAPSGRTERWGEDEPDAANVLEDFSDSDTAPGGHKDFTGALPRKPGVDYSDMKVGTKLEVMGAGGYKVSEYRLERTPRTSGDFLVMDPAASGYQVLLSDDEGARAIPLDSDMSAIGQPSGAFVAAHSTKRINLDAQVSLLPAGSASSKDSPALQHAWQHFDNEPTGEAFDMAISVYDALGIELGEMLLDCVATDAASMGGGWRREVWAWGDSNAESLNSEVHDFPNETVTDEVLALPAGTHLVAFLTLNRTEPFSGDGKWEVQYRNVKFRDRSALPLYGTWPEVGILASDFIAWALSQFAPGLHYTTGAYGSIKPSSFVIPHLAFKEPGAVLQMITQALRFEAMLEWGVWSGQFGPTFYLNERGKREGAKRWRARVRPAKLTETGQQMDQVYNKVVISWRDPDGTTKVMGPPGSGYLITDSRCEDTDPLNPINEAGASRTKHLTMEGIATAEGAAETARLFLEKVKLLDASGEATLTGFVEDDHGAEWPYYCVHAGDEIEFIDSSISGSRYIVEARRNRKARAVNIKIDAPPDSYEAILAELAVREAAAGLGS